MTEYGVVLFYTTSSAMRAEKLLAAEFATRLIPTPRQFSSDCGISLRFDWPHSETVEQLLNESKVEFEAIHFMEAASNH